MNKILQNYKPLVIFTFIFTALFIASRIPTHAQAVCTAKPQAQVVTPLLTANPGATVSNQLMITNPNPVGCSNADFFISRTYPAGWNLNIQNLITLAPLGTATVPFTITTASSGVGGSYSYKLSVISMVGDSTPVNAYGLVQLNTPTPTPTATNTPTPTPTPDITAPVVQIVSPANNSNVTRSSSVTITATATDNVGVTQVKFYVNNALKCTDTVAPYTCAFTASSKKNFTHTLKAVAYDAASNISSHTIQVITK